MRPDAYKILQRAVEEGVLRGLRRAVKYDQITVKDGDSELGIAADKIYGEVMDSICEVFKFDEEVTP